jgi:hypothetical protein
MAVVLALALVTAVVTAVRSTWSPCGVSMLSSITPLSERGRGRRFGATATWFVVGALAGGATLGTGAALLSFGADALSLSTDATLGVVAALALLTAVADTGTLGIRLPNHTRQVNDVWITRYRGWVCGVGFGWQIGNGLATFIVTPAVYLLIALAALTASPLQAFGTCVLFGFARGLAIWLGSRITSPESLVAFHRGFEKLRAPVRYATVVMQFAIAALAAVAIASHVAPVVVAAIALAVTLLTALATTRRHAGAKQPATRTSPPVRA